jgi:hypothetical protein
MHTRNDGIVLMVLGGPMYYRSNWLCIPFGKSIWPRAVHSPLGKRVNEHGIYRLGRPDFAGE